MTSIGRGLTLFLFIWLMPRSCSALPLGIACGALWSRTTRVVSRGFAPVLRVFPARVLRTHRELSFVVHQADVPAAVLTHEGVRLLIVAILALWSDGFSHKELVVCCRV